MLAKCPTEVMDRRFEVSREKDTPRARKRQHSTNTRNENIRLRNRIDAFAIVRGMAIVNSYTVPSCHVLSVNRIHPLQDMRLDPDEAVKYPMVPPPPSPIQFIHCVGKARCHRLVCKNSRLTLFVRQPIKGQWLEELQPQIAVLSISIRELLKLGLKPPVNRCGNNSFAAESVVKIVYDLIEITKETRITVANEQSAIV